VNPNAVGSFFLADSDPDLHPGPADPDPNLGTTFHLASDLLPDRQALDADLDPNPTK
jgi:hypothetical protein